MMNNIDNASTFTMNESSSINHRTSGSFAVITVQVSIYSLTIILVIFYTIFILVQPTLRQNKLNWFTVNVCLTSAWVSIIMLAVNVRQLLNAFGGLSCRSQTFVIDMATCLLMYSHCAFAVSRLLAIVYAHKYIFRSNLALWSCIVSGWLVSFFVAFPYLFVDGFLCLSSTQPAFMPYYSLITTLFLPILIVTICNARTLIFVRNSTRRVHATGTGGQVSHKRDVFLVKLTIGTFTAFIVGWTPSFSIQLFDKTASVPTILNQCAQILPALALLYDVLLLILTNQPVRTSLKRITERILKC